MKGGINLQQNNRVNQVGFSNLLTSLPPHFIIEIINRLSVQALLNLGVTCSQFRNFTDALPVWRELGAKLQGFSERLESKISVLARINLLFVSSRSENAEQAMRAHITLSRIDFSSLATAFSLAQKIAIKEEERNAHPSSSFHCESFHDKSVPLIEAYLQNNDLDQAEEMIRQMFASTMRGVLAFKIEKKFLEKGDFDRALSALRLVKVDQMESGQALSLFIWKAKQVATIDLAFEALNEFANISTALSCVKDFHGFLTGVGEVQKAMHLQEAHPDAFAEGHLYTDVEYYACNDQVDQAVQVAAALADVHERMAAFNHLTKIIREKGASLQNGQALLSRIRTLKLNIN